MRSQHRILGGQGRDPGTGDAHVAWNRLARTDWLDQTAPARIFQSWIVIREFPTGPNSVRAAARVQQVRAAASVVWKAFGCSAWDFWPRYVLLLIRRGAIFRRLWDFPWRSVEQSFPSL